MPKRETSNFWRTDFPIIAIILIFWIKLFASQAWSNNLNISLVSTAQTNLFLQIILLLITEIWEGENDK